MLDAGQYTLKIFDKKSIRSSGTRETPKLDDLWLPELRDDKGTPVRALNTVVLPDLGNPIMPSCIFDQIPNFINDYINRCINPKYMVG